MLHSKQESLHFYKYLCQKIGSKEVVAARRLTFLSKDLASLKLLSSIYSGSMAEGLNLKGSDYDIMFIDPNYAVYESNKNVVVQKFGSVLVIDTDDTQPGFTYLRFCDNGVGMSYLTRQTLQQHKGKNLLSNELFKSQRSSISKVFNPYITDKIHGPCISDLHGTFDFAFCLKADQWIAQAKPWITRSRSMWLPPKVISKITSWGVLFVPIGYKGSINENLQWRISFSTAEKILIYSFSHTQLLCYALLKIFLKEIVNRNEELKDLLCSYFLKTLMFWISEETETSVWRPDNIIPCFNACLQRLLYCLEYSTLLHYFIPEMNLFYLRFNKKHINIIKNSLQSGIQVFSSSQTLHDYRRFPCEITRSVCVITSLMKTIIEQDYCPQSPHFNHLRVFSTLLHHCKTELSRCVFKLSTATAYQTIPLALPQVKNPTNKQRYITYKHELSQLLVGVHSDATSGWLLVASFFYVHKNYLISIDIINYALYDCADESSLSKITMKQAQKLKLRSLLKTLPSPCVSFYKFGLNSSVTPIELKSYKSREYILSIKCMTFAHFLRFLCCYHLQDFESCGYCIYQLSKSVNEHRPSEKEEYHIKKNNFIALGIAFQMLGDRDRAREYFNLAAQKEKFNHKSAAL